MVFNPLTVFVKCSILNVSFKTRKKLELNSFKLSFNKVSSHLKGISCLEVSKILEKYVTKQKNFRKLVGGWCVVLLEINFFTGCF